jgi:hypothetical protein
LRLAFNLVAVLAVTSLALGMFLRGGRRAVRVAVAEPASRGPVQGSGEGGAPDSNPPAASEEGAWFDKGGVNAADEDDGGDPHLLDRGGPSPGSVTGALRLDDVLRAVQAHRDDVIGCIAIAARAGKVVFAWDILPSGDVTSPKVVSRTGDARVAQCLLRQLPLWHFPVAPSSTRVRDVPFVFAPAEERGFPSLSEPRHYEPPRSKEELKDLPF